MGDSKGLLPSFLNFYSDLEKYGALETLRHPFNYAETLIRLGYEPFAPQKIRRESFSPGELFLPTVPQLASYIATIDGTSGLFRALGPSLLEQQGRIHIHSAFLRFRPNRYDPENSSGLSTNLSRKMLQLYVNAQMYKLFSNLTVAIITQPVRVVSVACMGQFVGREANFQSPTETALTIWKEAGILGFFRGLMPRLVEEVSTMILSSAMFLSVMGGCNIVKVSESTGKMIEDFSSIISQALATSMTHQFRIISDIMVVNELSLAVGNQPFMKPYSSWLECWKHLSSTNQLSTRYPGTIFSRIYTGPVTINENGINPCKHIHFGPLYFPKCPSNTFSMIKSFYECSGNWTPGLNEMLDPLKSGNQELPNFLQGGHLINFDKFLPPFPLMAILNELFISRLQNFVSKKCDQWNSNNN